MVNSMKLHLEDMGPINEANIVIDKITVIGGHNSAGKSTLSKFLYSFLRSNSLNRQKIAYNRITNLMENQALILKNYHPREDYDSSFVNPELFDLRKFDFEKIKEYYAKMKVLYYQEDDFDQQYGYPMDSDFDMIDDLMFIALENGHNLYVSLMRNFLESEFLTSNFKSYIKINDFNDNFKFLIDFRNHDFNNDEAFKSESSFFVNDVFYIDSISVLDVFERGRLSSWKFDHLEYLRKNLTENVNDSSEIFDKQINKEIIDIEKEINNIIDGKFILEHGEFKFLSNNDIKSVVYNTASGTKQIGIIQLLLANRKLKPNSFLIIDEPEVNLHPEWQIKFAEILVLLAKELDINIYLNSHSPMFIEAISLYSQYYELIDETNFYLTIKQKNNKFNFNKIDSTDMGEVYENLTKPYDELDKLKAKILFKE